MCVTPWFDVQWDSWLTIGLTEGNGGVLSTIGIDLSIDGRGGHSKGWNGKHGIETTYVN